MYYKFTLLRDLPEYMAGTVFKCQGVSYRFDSKWEHRIPYYEIVIPGIPFSRIELKAVGGLFDDPEWFKKEVDVEKLSDFKCPICGETRGVLHYLTEKVMDGYGDTVCIAHAEIEYACGHSPRKF